MCTGDIVLFLHADCVLPQGFDEDIMAAFQDPQTILSSFKFRIASSSASSSSNDMLDPSSPNSLSNSKYKQLEWFTNWRSKYLWFPYGDQAISMAKEDFERLGGFPPFKMMEDFDFVVSL